MSKYNGYTNYETWIVALHIDNNKILTSEISEAYEYDRDPYEFQVNIKSIITHHAKIKDNDLASGLLNAALSEVNWSEIARLIIEDNLVKLNIPL